jgi:E3 ubiquitin-protein ligase RGLG
VAYYWAFFFFSAGALASFSLFNMGNSASSAPASPAQSGQLGSRSASFRVFRDTYSDVDSLVNDLRRAGLESCNLVVGIDFTASNSWQGKNTFGGRNLHALAPGGPLNFYESTLAIIARTLAPFDEDGLIPVYGFGDAATHDTSVMAFLPGEAPIHGLEGVLTRYRELVPLIKLAGPTSFGPIIRKACTLVKESGNAYHILVIIADGQVSRGSDMPANMLSEQERDTINAIMEACQLPLSIVVCGVGDGPWNMMEEFDDKLPERAFDNFQFVAVNDIFQKAQRRAPVGSTPDQVMAIMESTFALHALMECPEQYRAASNLGLLSKAAADRAQIRRVQVFNPPVLPPQGSQAYAPHGFAVQGGPGYSPGGSAMYGQGGSATYGPPMGGAGGYAPPPGMAPVPTGPPPSAGDPASASPECSVCLSNPPNMALNCGHTVCRDCGPQLATCPICRATITARIPLFQ